MANIRQLNEESGQVFYPQTHERAVIDSNGNTLDTKIAGTLKYTEQSLTSAQQGQARTNIGAASQADLVNIQKEEYVTAATLADRPAASASTLGKIYLVGPDANNQYDKYYTSFDGTTYSWVSAGTTEIDLTTYAKQTALDQLGQYVKDVDVEISKNLFDGTLESNYYMDNAMWDEAEDYIPHRYSHVSKEEYFNYCKKAVTSMCAAGKQKDAK